MADKWNFNDFSWVKTNITDIENVIMKKILPDKSLDFAQTLGSNLELGELYISGAQSDIYNSDSSVIAYRNLGTSYQQGSINKSKLTYIDTSILTIQLQDGKWNYSKFEWYESDNTNIKLYKILQSKALDNYSTPYSEMVDDELYIEDNLSETTKYNNDEWAMAYVSLKSKKYYAYIKKSTIELNWLAPSPNQPQPPISPEQSPTIPSVTIKEQTEKYESLMQRLEDSIGNINTTLRRKNAIYTSTNSLTEINNAILNKLVGVGDTLKLADVEQVNLCKVTNSIKFPITSNVDSCRTINVDDLYYTVRLENTKPRKIKISCHRLVGDNFQLQWDKIAVETTKLTGTEIHNLVYLEGKLFWLIGDASAERGSRELHEFDIHSFIYISHPWMGQYIQQLDILDNQLIVFLLDSEIRSYSSNFTRNWTNTKMKVAGSPVYYNNYRKMTIDKKYHKCIHVYSNRDVTLGSNDTPQGEQRMYYCINNVGTLIRSYDMYMNGPASWIKDIYIASESNAWVFSNVGRLGTADRGDTTMCYKFSIGSDGALNGHTNYKSITHSQEYSQQVYVSTYRLNMAVYPSVEFPGCDEILMFPGGISESPSKVLRYKISSTGSIQSVASLDVNDIGITSAVNNTDHTTLSYHIHPSTDGQKLIGNSLGGWLNHAASGRFSNAFFELRLPENVYKIVNIS